MLKLALLNGALTVALEIILIMPQVCYIVIKPVLYDNSW